MEKTWILSPNRKLTDDEKKLIWKKPIGMIKRHPDCIVVITTNRGYSDVDY